MTDTSERDLGFTRLIPIPRAKLWRCWTEPDLICRWFTPPPYETIRAEMDVRTGGSSLIVMRAPDGTEIPNPGVYLEVVPGERMVFTDAYTSAWEPSAKPFMTAILTFADDGDGTRYSVTVRHWSVEDREAHAAMGFETGWGIATDQLTALAATL